MSRNEFISLPATSDASDVRVIVMYFLLSFPSRDCAQLCPRGTPVSAEGSESAAGLPLLESVPNPPIFRRGKAGLSETGDGEGRKEGREGRERSN